ncbi:MAG: FAD-binding protein, partial [Oscillospiraceae bacterium]|nr:FAD-binding protein [Oscillospiraceae bacterium]
NYGKRFSIEHGARWHFGMKGQVLLQNEDGDVIGLIAQERKTKRYVKYLARKAVCVTTGDFSANRDMIWALLTENSEWAERLGMEKKELVGVSGRDGSGHKMCCWAGGLIEPSPRPTDQNGDCPSAPWGQVPMLWLNAYGKRFTNEASVTLSLGTMARQPKGLMCTITDSQYMKSICIAGVEHGGPNYGRPCYYDELEEDMSHVLGSGAEGYPVRCCTVVERFKSPVYGSDDLGELLDFIGYEGEAKQKALEEIANYNKLCYEKCDTDFGKDVKALIPIDKPPFYACKTDFKKRSHAKVGLNTLAGLVTDTDFNVLDEHGEPIKGLYVAGNTLGQRFGTGYATPCAGSSIGSAMTNGFVLAEKLCGIK